jgi:ketosteroid isomerase-like protein
VVAVATPAPLRPAGIGLETVGVEADRTGEPDPGAAAQQASAPGLLALGAHGQPPSGQLDLDVVALDAGQLQPLEWIEPESFPNGGRLQGRKAVAEYLRLSRERWAELTVEPTPYPRADDVVIVVRHHGRLRDGDAADVTVADVFKIRDGQVVRMEAFADPKEVLG